jgi:outer membrane protein
LYPNLNLTDAQNFMSGYSLDPYTYQYTTQSINTNQAALNSSLTLFNGFLLINTIRQNKLLYEAGVLDVEKIKNDIMLNVIAGYMQVLMDYEAIDVAIAQVKATNTSVEQTSKFVQFGKSAELSLLQVESQLAADKLTKVNADNQLQMDKVTLLQLMETPALYDFDIEREPLGTLFPEITGSTAEIDKISESFLPQIKSASLKTVAAIYSLKMAKGMLYPKLAMTGYLRTGYSSLKSDIHQQVIYNNQTIGYLDNNPGQPVYANVPTSSVSLTKQSLPEQLKSNFSQSVGFSLSVPIFNNLTVASSVAIAKINVVNAKLNQKQVQNDLRKSIETAFTNLVSAGKKLVATQEQLVLETRTYTDMEKKYSVGAVDATTFLIEKNNFNRVSMSLIQVKYDYVLKSKIVNFYYGKPLY